MSDIDMIHIGLWWLHCTLPIQAADTADISYRPTVFLVQGAVNPEGRRRMHGHAPQLLLHHLKLSTSSGMNTLWPLLHSLLQIQTD